MEAITLDEDGDVVITVGDVVKYLQGFPLDTPVHLDHDGWMGDELPKGAAQTPHSIIRHRGLFYNGGDCLIINN